jgi:GC-rich sequence DNA-binding factor
MFCVCFRLKTEKGRLVREDDDNDQSDEERLDFSSATNAAKIDRERIYEDFKAAQDERTDDDSDAELNEWENQQIRKGVSQAKVCLVRQSQ